MKNYDKIVVFFTELVRAAPHRKKLFDYQPQSEMVTITNSQELMSSKPCCFVDHRVRSLNLATGAQEPLTKSK